MANYSTLKAAVADVVKTNGTQAITGANLQAVLLSIINSVGGGGYIFKGVATPSTNAGTPDENVFYIGGAGTYTNFGSSYTVPVGSICLFKYNGSWVKEQIKMFEGIDERPVSLSHNLVESGGVEQYLAKKIISKVDSPTYTEGFMRGNGTVDTSATSYGYSAPITLHAGETIVLNQGSPVYLSSNMAVVYECNSTGTFIQSLICRTDSSTPNTSKESYTNTTDSDMYIGICGYKSQLKYYIYEDVEAASKESLDETNRELDDKISYNITDVTNTENIGENYWMKYSNGARQTASSSGQFSVRYYPCSDVIKVYCKVALLDDLPAAIAFYSGDTFDMSATTHTDYMLDDSVQAIVGTNEYLVDVPKGAKWVCITNRGATLANPVVKLYKFNMIDEAISEYDSELIIQSNISATSSGITNRADIHTVDDNTQLELEITEMGGDTELRVYFETFVGDVKTTIGRIYNVGVGKYYFEKVDGLYSVYFAKNAATGNVFNYKIRTLTKKYPIEQRKFASYIPSKQVSTIDLGTPFQGYYSINASDDSENTIVNANYWVTFPIQKTNGFQISVSFDDTVYAVNFSAFNSSFEQRNEEAISSSPRLIDLSSCRGWCLGIRKKDYSSFAPEDAVGKITVTKIGGYVYEKPLIKYEVEKVVDNYIGSAGAITKATEIAKEGFGLNPFVNRPFYYHFSANGFIKDGQNNRTIASESIEDVELAARLGFSFIEANIQPTSDSKFIVIHGSSGAFGPECKSINENVITTAALQETAINTKTLDWIKTYVRYDSYYTKYQTAIPSLEEFCEACKKNNIGIFAGTSQKTAVEICMKYLGNNVIVYGSPSDVRDYFNGWCLIWDNNTESTASTILAACRAKGAPVMYALGPALADTLYTGNNMNDLIKQMHDEGFLIGWTANYDTEEHSRKYLKLGMDFSSSQNDINPFVANYEVFDLDDATHQPSTTGTLANGVITLANSDTVTCGSTDIIGVGQGYVGIKFNGTLTFNFGSQYGNGRTITSDGSELVTLTDYFFQRKTQLVVTAGAATTISYFVYKTSRV